MNTGYFLLSLLLLSTLVLAAVSAVEISRVGALESDNANLSIDVNRLSDSISNMVSGESCFQTGLHGILWVRVVADSSGQPAQGAEVIAMILNYCQSPAYVLSPEATNSTGYAGPFGWTGDLTVTVEYAGGIYSFPAWTNGGENVATLSIPSGAVNITQIACIGLECTGNQ